MAIRIQNISCPSSAISEKNTASAHPSKNIACVHSAEIHKKCTNEKKYEVATCLQDDCNRSKSKQIVTAPRIKKLESKKRHKATKICSPLFK